MLIIILFICIKQSNREYRCNINKQTIKQKKIITEFFQHVLYQNKKSLGIFQ